MPGKDDIGHDLTLENALNLTTFAKQQGLHGVMTWDANNDSHGIDNNAPYAYNMGILSQLKQIDVTIVKSCCNIV
jgi:chitinase